ncbi:hypothetical protein, partial [Pontibacter actiniarum]|uniref:hypothetical protein n=1 Tax=Pontibacter actiniarum TaxID=323450 RepID=UPI00055F959E
HPSRNQTTRTRQGLKEERWRVQQHSKQPPEQQARGREQTETNTKAPARKSAGAFAFFRAGWASC